jgi:hypothetical protein
MISSSSESNRDDPDEIRTKQTELDEKLLPTLRDLGGSFLMIHNFFETNLSVLTTPTFFHNMKKQAHLISL